jgi:predicted amidohydrolase
MKIAIIHFGKGSDLDENEKNLLDLNIKAAKGGADLIVNPELSILPLSSPFSPLRRSSQAEDVVQSRAFAWWFATDRGPRFVERLYVEVVVRYRTHVVVDTIRAVPGYTILHNSALVIGPNDFEYVYDKRALTSDVVFATQGTSDLVPARLPLGNVGVMICGDYSVPLISRSLALNGSDIIVIPAAISSSTADTLKVRALENGIPFALANSYDRGADRSAKVESAIVAADGTVLDRCDHCESEILRAELNLSDPHVQRLRAEKRHGRRPDLYQGALVDLSSPLLRPSIDESMSPEIGVITVSGAAVDDYTRSYQLNDVISSAPWREAPVMLVLPELDVEKRDIQKHIRFAIDRSIYLACGYIENNIPMISLFTPGGEEIIRRQRVHCPAEKNGSDRSTDRIEQYVDLPFGRVGVLAGVDLLYPEAVEMYRNAGVDLILAPAHLDFDGINLFEDIAKARHMHIAVADYQHRGGIYTRFPQAHVTNEGAINYARFDIQSGRGGPANIPLVGLEILVRTSASNTVDA